MNVATNNAAVRNLSGLLAGIATPARDVALTDITADSREAVRGGLFLACQGIGSHGLQYLERALAAGVSAVVWEPAPGIDEPAVPAGVVSLPVMDLSGRLGEIADRFFGAPSAAVSITGITGTNGKTTTAWLLAQAFDAAGVSAGYGGTLGWGRVNKDSAAGAFAESPLNTTPDCISLHRQVAALRDGGARALAMEVSSHALAQDRVAGLRFDTAVFTNLSRDHLDYHGTMDAYGAAKARLFVLPGVRRRVVNTDDDFGRRLAASLPADAVLTGLHSHPDKDARHLAGEAAETRFVQALELDARADGLTIAFDSSWGRGTLRSRLLGDFNAENLLTALAVLLASQLPLADAVAALEDATPPPGRMETFHGTDKQVVGVVDYAHTPDALAKALTALRRHCRGRLWCVFGCGGDRDAGKRPQMGAVAAQLADEIVITDDNPRSEDGARIVAAIAAGVPAGARVRTERDRAKAIAHALRSAAAGDLVLVAGKGHENYQIYGAERRHFSDREELQRFFGGAA